MASFDFRYAIEVVFHEKVNIVYVFLRGNFVRFEIPDPAGVLKIFLDDYNTKFEAAEAPDRRKTAPALRKEAREKVAEEFTKYGKEYLFNNHRVTLADQLAMFFHQDKPRTPIKPPNSAPIIMADTSVAMQVAFYYMMAGMKKPAKPDKVHAFVLRYGFFPVGYTPKSAAELTHTEISTAPPKIVKGTDENRGMALWFSGAWQISKDGQEGPSTPLDFVIFP
jgi:hypothetical protein